jgi:hypothetical protein
MGRKKIFLRHSLTMSKYFISTVAILFLMSSLSFAEEPKPQGDKKESQQERPLEDMIKFLPSYIKKQYEIPKDFLEQPSKDKTNPQEQKAAPEKTTPDLLKSKAVKPGPSPVNNIQKAPRMEPPENKSFLESLLDTLFGPGKKANIPVANLRPSTIVEEEKDTALIEKIKQHKEQIRGIEQLESLKPLETIIDNAMKNSPDIQKAKLEAEIIKRQNTFTPVPTFTIGNDFATGKTIISAGVQLPLEPLFTGRQREKYGELSIRQQQEEVAQRCIDQYRTVISTAKKLESRKTKRKYIEQLVKNADEQYKGGLIKLDELIKAQELQWTLETEEQNFTIDLETQIEKLKTIENGGK